MKIGTSELKTKPAIAFTEWKHRSLNIPSKPSKLNIPY